MTITVVNNALNMTIQLPYLAIIVVVVIIIVLLKRK